MRVYKVSGGSGGRCSCGHRTRMGETYLLLEAGSRSWTFCGECGEKFKFKGEEVTAEEMKRKWFGEEPLEKIIRDRLPAYVGV